MKLTTPVLVVPASFILTKWYVNTAVATPSSAAKQGFILTKWYVNYLLHLHHQVQHVVLY
ncbi:hypothetical protein QAS_1486 [Clostridioides difficile CD9]|nr:hypothetical protein QAS_1486 [Clostridioides difficile CD9]EQE12364.1 hypothetical protein QAO_1381 [Clostridioides difficile CD3]EQE13095.1 hypothetical protein QAQ_1450 [Clostridioides difficile CD8]EQG29837.1 hypothetical protein QIK_1434 [Clostridioides difficile DA00126]EQG66237.1 hypothetical protein QK1_1500 [Clostridioides difficile DA00142]EQG77898.1 hypothetical protein QKA_1080 [Clostridioides difficile DA00165]EQG94078.1 hypothetical protein QKK_1561 [Clostridioides difficile 